MIRNTLLLFCLVCLLIGCKRYEEGPSFSLTPAKSRITGVWEVTKCISGGKWNCLDHDSAKHITCTIGDTTLRIEPRTEQANTLTFKKKHVLDVVAHHFGDKLDYQATRELCEPVFVPQDTTYTDTGYWGFVGRKKVLQMDYPFTTDEFYDILKLTKDEMILESGWLYMELKKKEN